MGKKGFSTILIIAVALTIIVLMGAIWYYFVSVSKQPNQDSQLMVLSTPGLVPTTSTQPIHNLSPTSSPTNSNQAFLEYNNPTTGLGFEYPSNWTVQNATEPGTGPDAIKIVDPNGNPRIFMEPIGRVDNQLQDQIARINCNFYPPSDNTVSCENLESKNSVIYSRKILNNPPHPGDHLYEIEALIATGRAEIVVSPQIEDASIDAVVSPTGSDAITINVFDQILSTLFIPNTPQHYFPPLPSGNPTTSLQTYTNQIYGFTFQYPTNWKLTVSPDGRGVSVDDNIPVISGLGRPISALVVSVRAWEDNAFGTVQSKSGSIQYDASRTALVDSSSNPPRCLPVQYDLGILTSTPVTLPVIVYGGSLMSDPASMDSAILTDKGYMILISAAGERTGNQAQDAEISNSEGAFFSSLKLIPGVHAVVPGC